MATGAYIKDDMNEIIQCDCLEVMKSIPDGSGTTCVACVNLKRSYIGIEMDDKYFNDAKDRIEQAKNLFSEAV